MRTGLAQPEVPILPSVQLHTRPLVHCIVYSECTRADSSPTGGADLLSSVDLRNMTSPSNRLIDVHRSGGEACSQPSRRRIHYIAGDTRCCARRWFSLVRRRLSTLGIAWRRRHQSVAAVLLSHMETNKLCPECLANGLVTERSSGRTLLRDSSISSRACGRGGWLRLGRGGSSPQTEEVADAHTAQHHGIHAPDQGEYDEVSACVGGGGPSGRTWWRR